MFKQVEIYSGDSSFSFHVKILDEVERRRGISAALVYPFMRSLMESPFPAPGKIIKVKTFLPGAGNEVRAADKAENTCFPFHLFYWAQIIGPDDFSYIRVKYNPVS